MLRGGQSNQAAVTAHGGAMVTRRHLAEAVRDALMSTGVAPERATSLTLHSFRRYLACALLGQRVSPDQICALLRWKSTKSLAAYAHLTPDAYASMVESATKTKIDSVITANLPTTEAEDVAFRMAQAAGKVLEIAQRPLDREHDDDVSDGEDE